VAQRLHCAELIGDTKAICQPSCIFLSFVKKKMAIFIKKKRRKKKGKGGNNGVCSSAPSSSMSSVDRASETKKRRDDPAVIRRFWPAFDELTIKFGLCFYARALHICHA
jgi:hypothetical protein